MGHYSRSQDVQLKTVTRCEHADTSSQAFLWHMPCNPCFLFMHDNTKRQTRPQILVASKFAERRMEIITLMWIGFWTGILLGGISVLMR